MSKKYVYKYPLTPAVSSDVSIPNQNTGNEENEDTLVQEKNNVIQEDKINVLAEEERKNFINSLKSIHSENNIGYDMQYRFEDIAQKLTKFLKRDVTYWNTGNEEKEDTLVQEKDNFIQEDKVLKLSSSKDTERPAEDIKVFSGSKTSSEKTGKKLAEVLKLLFYFSISSKDTEKPAEDIKVFSGSKTSSEKTGKKLAEVLKLLCYFSSSSKDTEKPAEDIKDFSGSKTSSEKTGKKLAEDIKVFSGSKTSSEKTGKKLAEDIKFLSGSKTSSEKTGKNLAEDIKFLSGSKTSSENTGKKLAERHKITEASEGSTNRPIHPVDRRTTYNSQEDNGIGMRGSLRNKILYKVQDEQIPSSEVNTYISSVESWSTFESTLIRLYRNVIRNDTSRMMSSIDMVGFKAEHLFGLERSRIFFDLLDEELCHFESAGAISDFVPNMAESTVRQHVISFFEHAYDMMSKLMTLLSCPYSKILQQMPVQNFISLMKSVIESSLKAQTKGREKLFLEGNIYIMVDPRDFERALVEEFPEDVLNRLGNEDEIVVNRLYHCIYFPSDCRLYIYIPTATGSYWHHSGMRRADRIRRHG